MIFVHCISNELLTNYMASTRRSLFWMIQLLASDPWWPLGWGWGEHWAQHQHEGTESSTQCGEPQSLGQLKGLRQRGCANESKQMLLVMYLWPWSCTLYTNTVKVCRVQIYDAYLLYTRLTCTQIIWMYFLSRKFWNIIRICHADPYIYSFWYPFTEHIQTHILINICCVYQ